VTFTAFPASYGLLDPATQALVRFGQDIQTGLTTTALTLENTPVAGSLLLFKNTDFVPPIAGATGYSISGRSITLGTAAIAGDTFVAMYHFAQVRE